METAAEITASKNEATRMRIFCKERSSVRMCLKCYAG